MIVVGVDEGDVKATGVQLLGQLHHRIDVSLSRVGDAYGMGLLCCCCDGTHASLYLSIYLSLCRSGLLPGISGIFIGPGRQESREVSSEKLGFCGLPRRMETNID